VGVSNSVVRLLTFDSRSFRHGLIQGPRRFWGLIRARCSAASLKTSSHGTRDGPDHARLGRVARLQGLGGLVFARLALLVGEITPALNNRGRF
jgi:hypothetical protein